MLGRVTSRLGKQMEKAPKQEKVTSQSSTLKLSNKDMDIIRKDVLENHEDLMKAMRGTSIGKGPFKKVGRGCSCLVFVHESYPDFVIKLGKINSLKNRYLVNKTAYEVVRDQHLDLITIPRSTFIPLPNEVKYCFETMGIFVQEKVTNILDGDRHRELWDLVIEEYQSTKDETFKENLLKLISQVTTFIGKTGFFDIQLGNGPLFISNGSKAFIIDFGMIDPEKQTKDHRGYTRFAKFLPTRPFTDKIYKGADIVDENFDKQFLKEAEEGKKEFDNRTDARKVYQNRRWTFPTEDFPKIDYSKIPKDYRDFALTIENELKEELEDIKKNGDAVPLFKRNITKIQNFSNNEEKKLYRDRAERTLNILKEQGVVVSWSLLLDVTNKYGMQVMYMISF